MSQDPFNPFGYLLEDALPPTGFGLVEGKVDFSSIEQDLLTALRRLPRAAPEVTSEPSDEEKVFKLDGAAFDFSDKDTVDLTLTVSYREPNNQVAFDLTGPEGSSDACRNALVDILVNAKIGIDTGAVKAKSNGASVSIPGTRDKEEEAFGEDRISSV